MAMLNNQMVTQINQILKYLKSPGFWKKKQILKQI